MGIKIKNLQTGEFEKFNIPALKGEKGEPGEIEPSEKVDYIGKQHSKLRDTMNANVDYIIKTTIGEFNYLDYEGQHITATNSIEGHVKSAILSGQTLVNLVQQKDMYLLFGTSGRGKVNRTITTSGTIYETSRDDLNSYITIRTEAHPLIKPNTSYTIFFEVVQNTITRNGVEYKGVTVSGYNDSYYGRPGEKQLYHNGEFSLSKGLKKIVITTPSSVASYDGLGFGFPCFVANETPQGQVFEIQNVMIIEGDYTNVDIPYFEGMASCKMPVLGTFNNIVDFSNEKLEFEYGIYFGQRGDGTDQVNYKGVPSSFVYTLNYINILDGKDKMTCYGNDTIVDRVVWFDENKKQLGAIVQINNRTLDIPTGAKYFRFLLNDSRFAEDKELAKDNIGHYNIYYGGVSQIFNNEPHKTNILTVNEDVELRGIGDVQDTLDCLTGEVTERIGEIVLDGSESWNEYTSQELTNTRLFYCGVPTNSNINTSKFTIINNRFASLNPNAGGLWNTDVVGFGDGVVNNAFRLRVLKSTANTINELKEYLHSNPIVVQYELSEKSIKTVDLSDNHVYSYKGTTHYDCSSAEGSLVPTLSVKVPTDTQLTIQEQKATTQTLLIKNMDLQQSIKEVQAMNLAFNTVLYNSFNSIREEVEDIKKHVSTNENLEGSF